MNTLLLDRTAETQLFADPVTAETISDTLTPPELHPGTLENLGDMAIALTDDASIGSDVVTDNHGNLISPATRERSTRLGT